MEENSVCSFGFYFRCKLKTRSCTTTNSPDSELLDGSCSIFRNLEFLQLGTAFFQHFEKQAEEAI
jgi:hypothetical protein